MKVNNFILIGLLLFSTLFGCKDDEPVVEIENGAIFVEVMLDGDRISDAIITTMPSTIQATTDELGTALLNNVPPGIYQVFATHPSIGSGVAAATVKNAEVSTISITLIDGVFSAPLVSISTPLSGGEYSYIDDITIKAQVSDAEDAVEDLTLVWTSSLDGELSANSANSSGLASVVLSNLSLGEHVITVTVTDSDELSASASISLFIRSFSPELSIQAPENNAGFFPGSTVEFEVLVTDRENAVEELQIQWASDLDGILHNNSPNSDGISVFSTTTLSQGQHLISVTVTDTDDNATTLTRTIATNLPIPVTLQPLTKTTNVIQLNWTAATIADFSSYKLYRSTSEDGPFELINIINTIEETTYEDTDLNFKQSYWYQIGLTNTDMAESVSNIENITAGISIYVGTQIEYMITDPTRPFIYALDRVNNSLLFISTSQFEVTKTIFVGSSPVHLDMDLDNNRLFIANFGSNQVAVVNLNTQEVSTNLAVDVASGWDGNPYRIVYLDNDRLVYTSEDQWCDLKMVSANTGTHIQTTGSIYKPHLLTNPEKNRVYVAESGSSGSQLLRYDLIGTQLTEVDQSVSTSSTGRVAVISNNGEFIFYQKRKHLAANLASTLGTFAENIYATNYDGSLVVGNQTLFDATTFATIRTLPVSSTTMTLDPDDNTLYMYDDSSSEIIIYLLDPS